jgi:RimJ/RimL family protein N-acetyltransferase
VPSLVPPHLPAGSLSSRLQPVIDAGPLELRPFESADAGWLVEVHRDPDIQRWHLRRFDSADEALGWIELGRLSWAAETDANWLVADATTGERLGRVGLRTIELGWGTAECSYWVAPSARGRGVATRALRAVTAWAVGDVGLHRLTVTHSTENTASCGVAAAAGYTAEGTSRSQQLHLDGWHDKHVHAFVAGDPPAEATR